MRAVYAVAALAVAATTASCSGSASPDPSPTLRPDNAGTLVVHAYRISGPVAPPAANGRPVRHPIPLINVTIRLRAADGFIRSASTNENGAARFVVAPGRYRAHVVYACTGLASV